MQHKLPDYSCLRIAKSAFSDHDIMYAMAALPLALEPIQKIPFIVYAHARFTKFLLTYEQRFGE